MRADIAAGAVFPDYELTDHTGERRKLSDLQGPDEKGKTMRDDRLLAVAGQMHCYIGFFSCSLIRVAVGQRLHLVNKN